MEGFLTGAHVGRQSLSYDGNSAPACIQLWPDELFQSWQLLTRRLALVLICSCSSASDHELGACEPVCQLGRPLLCFVRENKTQASFACCLFEAPEATLGEKFQHETQADKEKQTNLAANGRAATTFAFATRQARETRESDAAGERR